MRNNVLLMKKPIEINFKILPEIISGSENSRRKRPRGFHQGGYNSFKQPFKIHINSMQGPATDTTEDILVADLIEEKTQELQLQEQ